MVQRVVESDLFDPAPEDWLDKPVVAFDTWLAGKKGRGGGASHGIKVSSVKVYRVQWGAFLRFLSKASVRRLEDVTEAHVSGFLASLMNENQNQRARIRSLIERALADILAERSAVGKVNPAVLSLLAPSEPWHHARKNRPTSFLGEAQAQALIAYLEAPVMLPTLSARWREARDRALVAVFLGAGLKVVESLRLTINCVTDDYQWLNVQRDTSQFSHRTQLMAFAQPLLAHWLTLRAQTATPGERVFPADVDGRPMHAVTALRATNAIVARCGLTRTRDERTSPQTLRNTYGAHMLARGETDLALCASLGFTELVTAARMRAAWNAWRTSQAPAPG